MFRGTVVSEPVVYQEKHLLVVWVPGGKDRPYLAPEDAIGKTRPNKYVYIRKGSSSIRAADNELKELYYMSTKIPFDDRPCFTADVFDLDKSLFLEFLTDTGSSMAEKAHEMSVEDLAESLRLMSVPPEFGKPNHAAVLFFRKNPQQFFPYARIEIAGMPDPTGNGMIEKTFTGSLPNQLKGALNFIKTSVLQSKLFKPEFEPESIVYWNYPYQAVEEILSNSISHQDYTLEEPVFVRITPTELSVTSYPGLHRSITQQNIDDGHFIEKYFRSRRIGDFLKDLKLIEGRNTGFPTAKQALERNGSEELKIKMDKNLEYLTVTIPIHPAFRPNACEDSGYQMKILEHLKSEPSTLTELAKKMGYKGITSKLKRNVNDLKSQKFIITILDLNDRPKLAAAAVTWK